VHFVSDKMETTRSFCVIPINTAVASAT